MISPCKYEARNAAMLALRKQGYTHAAIAKEFGITTQRVNQILAERNANHFRPWREEDCIYPGLRNWLNDNRISKSELYRRLYDHNVSGGSNPIVKKWLTGEGDFRKSKIDILIEETGMTYEQLFWKGGEP